MKLSVGGGGLLAVLVLGLHPVIACRPPDGCEQLELPRASPSQILLQSNQLKQGVNQSAAGQPATQQQEAPHEETQQPETHQQEALRQEAQQSATHPQEAPRQQADQVALREQVQRPETFPQEALREEARQREALRKEARQPAAHLDEALPREARQPASHPREALRQQADQAALREEALQKEVQQPVSHLHEALPQESQQPAAHGQEAQQPAAFQEEALQEEARQLSIQQLEAVRRKAHQQEIHRRIESSHEAVVATTTGAPMVLVIVTVALCVLALGVGLYGAIPVAGKRDLAVPAPAPGATSKQVALRQSSTPRSTQAALAMRESMASETPVKPLLDLPGGEGAGRPSSTPAPSMLSVGRGPSIATPSIGHATPRTARGEGPRAQAPQPQPQPQQGAFAAPLLGQAQRRSSNTLSSASRAQPQQAPNQAGTFLCPGLVVPAECECLLLVPRLNPDAVSCEVTDSHRVPVFRVAYRHPSQKIADGGKCLVLKSYADDNAVFAFCCLGHSGSLTILDAGETPFGLIRGSKRGNFEVETRLGTQIKVILTDGNELVIVDRRGRTIALTENVPKNSLKRMVRIGPFVDAGLITLAVLASDLLDSEPPTPPS